MRILLVSYDNGSYMTRFPSGLAYIASALQKEGYYVRVYDQDIHHYPDEHLTKYLDDHCFDVVGVGVIGGYYQYRKLLSLSKAINKSKNRPFFVIGGHGPSPEPEYFLKKTQADVAVIGEGEVTIVNLLKAVEDKTSLAYVDGIAFRQGEEVTVNPRQTLIANIDDITMPAYNLFNMDCYRLARGVHTDPTDFVMNMLSGRGCKFECNFCYRMDKGIRIRSNESIMEEINMLNADYRINYFQFYDELLMTSQARAIDLSEAIIKNGLKIKWYCNGRLNYATEDVIKAMKAAGCEFINYGIECFDDQILINMNKALNTKQIVRGIENTLKYGITPGLNVIFGNIGENKETLRKSTDFLLKYSDWMEMRTIRPVTPYPGSPLYYEAIESGLLEGPEDFYENKHVNSDLLSVNFTDLTDDEVYQALSEANTELIEKYYDYQKENVLRQSAELYDNKDVGFRGFRQT